MRGYGFGPSRARRRTAGPSGVVTPTPTPTSAPTPTPTPTPTPAPTPTLLAHTERFSAVGNSYMGQGGNIDVLQWMWIGMGCCGFPTAGMRLASGGDRIDHATGRVAPVNALRAGYLDLMNIENDLTNVTNDNAGGDAIYTRLQNFLTAVRAVTPNVHVAVAKLANTNGRSGKPLAAARYDGLLDSLNAGDTKIHVHDEGAAFDAASAAQSTDGVHPNKRLSSRALGLSKGALAASLFDPADIFAGGLQLAHALNKTGNGSTLFSSASNWTANMNSSGLAVVQANTFLADRPTVPARSFTFSGTAAADETLSTAAPDASCSLTFNLPTGHSSFGKNYAVIMLLEVTNAAGNGPPVNLASLSFTLGSSASLFTKTVSAANASDWIEMFKGPVGLTPGAPLALQAASMALAMVVRGKNGLPIDCMVRIAALNIIETEAAAYGEPTFTGKAYNAGRPVIGSIPTMTPASGTYSEGTPININQPGTCLGGGLTRNFEVVNELGQVVGSCSPAYNGVPAIPYLAQANDVGAGKTLKVRSHAGNGFGADYMDTAVRASV